MTSASIPSIRALRFAAWQAAFEATLQTTDTSALFKLVEIAEAAILVRRDLLNDGRNERAERRAIEEALDELLLIKRQKLRFFPATANELSLR
jgi:hypothetical protein